MTRLKLLQQIFSNFQSAAQWITSHPDNYVKYMNKAEVLIEILEVEDCGSIGGFDKSNKVKNITNCNLYDRFLTVLRKNHEETDINPVCGFTVEKLGSFYKVVAQLRKSLSK